MQVSCREKVLSTCLPVYLSTSTTQIVVGFQLLVWCHLLQYLESVFARDFS